MLPEHTLPAYLRALEEGADGVECDVRLTRDGHLVCVHDRRLERTSNGHGRVSGHTLAKLERLDFGSWHPGAAAAEAADARRVLTLERLLHALRDVGRPVRLVIETKHPNRYGPQVEQRLVALLEAHGLATPVPDAPVQVAVMSFSPLAIRRVRRLAPNLPTVQLLEAIPAVPRGRLPFGTRIAGPGVRLVRLRPGLVSALRDAGNQVYVWTVNRPTDLDLVLRLGVDGIITDRPAETLARVGRCLPPETPSSP